MAVPKGKAGRIIFRKIKGRIIPIKIKNLEDSYTAINNIGDKAKYRKIIAYTEKHGQIGSLNLKIPKKGNSGEILSVSVEEKFRKKGISSNLFRRAADFLSRIGKKFINSSDVQSPAQLKIRSAYGVGYSIRAGGKYKNRTRFIADQFGIYGEQSKVIKLKEALEILKNNKDGRQVKASTMLISKKLRESK